MKNNRHLRLSFNNWLLYLLVIIFYLLVNSIFIFEIALSYDYKNFIDNGFQIENFLSVVFFSLFPLYFLPKKIDTPSSAICWTLYFFSYLPTAFIYIYFCLFLTEYYQLMSLLLLGFILIRITTLKRIRFTNWIKINFLGIDYFFLFIFFIPLIFYLWGLSDFGINFDLKDTYERRLSVRGNYGFLGYFIVLIKTAFLVFSVYLYAKKRKLSFLILAFFGVFGIFAFDGTKAPIIFAIVLLFYGLFFYKFGKISTDPKTFLLIFIGICLASILSSYLFESKILSDLFVRRAFIVPGLINGYYFDYFQLFPDLLTPPQSVSYKIGEMYFFSKDANANSGIWMNAFAKFGLVGLIFISFFSGFIAVIFDAMIDKHNKLLGIFIGLMVGLTWVEQAFTTSIFSGGIFFYLILLMWIKSSKHL